MEMAPQIPFVVVLVFCTSFHLLGMCEAVTMDIQPKEVAEKTQEDVRMSCLSGRFGNKEILLIQISRKGGAPLADIRLKNQNSIVRKANLSNSDYEVEGHLDSQRSNLSVFVLKPTLEWSGIYVCKVYYVDLFSHAMLEEAAEVNLTVRESHLKRVNSLEGRVKELEKMSQKEKNARVADKTLLLKKFVILETRNRNHSSQIKSMTNKEHAIEKDLEKTKENLSREVKNRLSDKNYTHSVIDSKVNNLEQRNEDQLKRMNSIETKMSTDENALKNTNIKLSQEVKNRQSDTASISLLMQKINAVVQKNVDQANEIKYLKEKNEKIMERLSSMDDTNKIQSGNIQDLFNRFSSSVNPALDELKRLQNHDDKMSRQIKGLEDRISTIKESTSTPVQMKKVCLFRYNAPCLKYGYVEA